MVEQKLETNTSLSQFLWTHKLAYDSEKSIHDTFSKVVLGFIVFHSDISI